MALIRAFPITLLVMAASGRAADSGPTPDYFAAMRQELARLSLEAVCDPVASTCVFSKSLPDSGRAVEVSARYSAATRTVYVCVERFLELRDPEGPDVELARKLLEMNRRMVTAKLEWERSTSCIRLSTVLSTDSNFDRKAFRSQVLGLLSNADRLYGFLRDVG